MRFGANTFGIVNTLASPCYRRACQVCIFRKPLETFAVAAGKVVLAAAAMPVERALQRYGKSIMSSKEIISKHPTHLLPVKMYPLPIERTFVDAALLRFGPGLSTNLSSCWVCCSVCNLPSTGGTFGQASIASSFFQSTRYARIKKMVHCGLSV
jgi:hypothetical protein